MARYWKKRGIRSHVRQTIKDLDDKWGLDLALYPTAEAQIANLSDDIAYLSHDFDDALRAELLTLDQIDELPVVGRHPQNNYMQNMACCR